MASTRPRNTHIPLNLKVSVPQEVKDTGELLSLPFLSEKAQRVVYDFLEAGYGDDLVSWLHDVEDDYTPCMTDVELNALLEEEGEHWLNEIKGAE